MTVDAFRIEIDRQSHAWMDEAKCLRFVSMGGKNLWLSDNPIARGRAQDICAKCPVLVTCKGYAVENRGQLCGVVAGVYYPFRDWEDRDGKKTGRAIHTGRSGGDGEALRHREAEPRNDRIEAGLRPQRNSPSPQASRDQKANRRRIARATKAARSRSRKAHPASSGSELRDLEAAAIAKALGGYEW